MRADYESEARTLAIELTSVDSADYGDDETPRAVIAIKGGEPVAIDVLNADQDVETPLAAVAARYELDYDALVAAVRSALAVPDREVVLEVRDRAAA